MLLFEQVRPFTFKSIQIFPPTISFRCQSLPTKVVWKSGALVASWEQGIFSQDHFILAGVPNNRLKDHNYEWLEVWSAPQVEACLQKYYFESTFPKSKSFGAIKRAPFWLLYWRAPGALTPFATCNQIVLSFKPCPICCTQCSRFCSQSNHQQKAWWRAQRIAKSETKEQWRRRRWLINSMIE